MCNWLIGRLLGHAGRAGDWRMDRDLALVMPERLPRRGFRSLHPRPGVLGSPQRDIW